MNENEIDQLPAVEETPTPSIDGVEAQTPSDEGLKFHWVQLLIGAALCYFWFYRSWTSMLALALVVIIHELGHVVMGKKFGCFITEMQVFLLCFVSYKPKQVAGGSRWRDITWSLGTLPLGGFTLFKSRQTQEAEGAEAEAEAEELVLDDEEAAASPYFDDKPAWQRLLISAGGVLFNIATFFIMYLAFPFIPYSWEQYWWAPMSLSLILAVLNILPIYPLDGGAIIFACYEIAAGRKPSEQFIKTCGTIGFILIILFFWVFPGFINDILHNVLRVFF